MNGEHPTLALRAKGNFDKQMLHTGKTTKET